MKRPIITAEQVQSLRNDSRDSQGKECITLPENAMLTPSAMDLIRSKAIVVNYASAEQPSACAPACPSSCETVPCDEASFAALRQAVLEKLPPELRNSPLVDSLIRKASQQNGASCSASASGSSSIGLASLAKPQAVNNDSAWRTEASGAVCINSQKLPWTPFSGAGDNAVSIIDVIGTAENAPWGVGYLEWNAAAFDWKLDYAEVDIVLEGELHITIDGKTLVGKPGDVLFIPKGTSLRFASPSHVKFVYVTWPADWNGAA